MGLIRIIRRWLDARTKILTMKEIDDLAARFPALLNHYQRGVINGAELARCYRRQSRA